MFYVGLENGTEGRSQAWVLGHPGCFAYGMDGSEAMAAVPQAIRDYRQWIAAHTSENWLAASVVSVASEASKANITLKKPGNATR
jgi:hypothetical protein